jgi:hypothetical protein
MPRSLGAHGPNGLRRARGIPSILELSKIRSTNPAALAAQSIRS